MFSGFPISKPRTLLIANCRPIFILSSYLVADWNTRWRSPTNCPSTRAAQVTHPLPTTESTVAMPAKAPSDGLIATPPSRLAAATTATAACTTKVGRHLRRRRIRHLTPAPAARPPCARHPSQRPSLMGRDITVAITGPRRPVCPLNPMHPCQCPSARMPSDPAVSATDLSTRMRLVCQWMTAIGKRGQGVSRDKVSLTRSNPGKRPTPDKLDLFFFMTQGSLNLNFFFLSLASFPTQSSSLVFSCFLHWALKKKKRMSFELGCFFWFW